MLSTVSSSVSPTRNKESKQNFTRVLQSPLTSQERLNYTEKMSDKPQFGRRFPKKSNTKKKKKKKKKKENNYCGDRHADSFTIDTSVNSKIQSTEKICSSSFDAQGQRAASVGRRAQEEKSTSICNDGQSQNIVNNSIKSVEDKDLRLKSISKNNSSQRNKQPNTFQKKKDNISSSHTEVIHTIGEIEIYNKINSLAENVLENTYKRITRSVSRNINNKALVLLDTLKRKRIIKKRLNPNIKEFTSGNVNLNTQPQVLDDVENDSETQKKSKNENVSDPAIDNINASETLSENKTSPEERNNMEKSENIDNLKTMPFNPINYTSYDKAESDSAKKRKKSKQVYKRTIKHNKKKKVGVKNLGTNREEKIVTNYYKKQKPRSKIPLSRMSSALAINDTSERTQCTTVESRPVLPITDSLGSEIRVEQSMPVPSYPSRTQTIIRKQYKYEEVQAEIMSNKHRVVLDEMMSNIKLVNIFKCSGRFCYFTTDSAEDALLHASTHTRVGGEDSLNCVYCDYDASNNVIDLITHVFKIHGRCPYVCNLCFYRAMTVQLVDAHIKRLHEKETNHQILHTSIHTGPYTDDHILLREQAVQYYVCTVGRDTDAACKFKTYTPRRYSEHFRSKHDSEIEISCDRCPMKLSSAADLIAHMKIHGLNLYQCAWCIHGSDNKAGLLAHSSSNHPDKVPKAYLRIITKKASERKDNEFMVLPFAVLNTTEIESVEVVPQNFKENPVGVAERSIELERLISRTELMIESTSTSAAFKSHTSVVCLDSDEESASRKVIDLSDDASTRRVPTPFKKPTEPKGQKRSLSSKEKVAEPPEKITHLKMHDSKLYACSLCSFYHYSRKFLENHLNDVHKEGQVMIVREENSVTLVRASPPQLSTVAPTMECMKPWQCGLCEYKSLLHPEVVDHCDKIHNAKMQYKCGYCTFLTSNSENITNHQIESHRGKQEEIFYFYYQEGSVPDDQDGMPRWQKQSQKFVVPVKIETSSSDINLMLPIITQVVSLRQTEAPENQELDLNSVKKVAMEANPETINNVCKKFGEFCEPIGLKYKCPLCKDIEDTVEAMQFHLYQELNYTKWGCSICSYRAFFKIDLNKHTQIEHRQNQEAVSLQADVQIETWVTQLLEHQTALIVKNKENLAIQKNIPGT